MHERNQLGHDGPPRLPLLPAATLPAALLLPLAPRLRRVALPALVQRHALRRRRPRPLLHRPGRRHLDPVAAPSAPAAPPLHHKLLLIYSMHLICHAMDHGRFANIIYSLVVSTQVGYYQLITCSHRYNEYTQGAHMCDSATREHTLVAHRAKYTQTHHASRTCARCPPPTQCVPMASAAGLQMPADAAARLHPSRP